MLTKRIDSLPVKGLDFPVTVDVNVQSVTIDFAAETMSVAYDICQPGSSPISVKTGVKTIPLPQPIKAMFTKSFEALLPSMLDEIKP